MTIQPQDEGPHPAGAEEDWQESVYLAWRDPARGIGGNHRIGNEANRGTANLWCGVYADTGVRFRHNGEGLPLRQVEAGHGLQAGPLAMYHDGERLRLVLDGEGCQLNLVVAEGPDAVVWLPKDRNPLRGDVYSDHYNSHCRVSGEAELGGQTFAVEANAWRDHSWGVRQWGNILCSRTFGGCFAPQQTFKFLSFLGPSGQLVRRGYVAIDGRTVPWRDFELVVEMEEDGVSARGGRASGKAEDGSAHHFEFEVVGGMLGVTRERCGYESVARAYKDGWGEGWGYCEINNNPRQGMAGPYLALHQGLDNGVHCAEPRLLPGLVSAGTRGARVNRGC